MTARAPSIDARHAVPCSPIFDRGIWGEAAPPPFGFELVEIVSEPAAGYLAALLSTRRPAGGPEWVLVNRGTRFETGSIGGLLRGLVVDMGSNPGIALGRADAPIVDAALGAMEQAVATARRLLSRGDVPVDPEDFPLRLLGQPLGGGLARLQAVAAWLCAAGDPTWPRLRFTTFAASDVGRVMTRRFGWRIEDLPPDIGVNHVSARDRLTGPRSLFGPPRIGVPHVVTDMEGPALVGLGLDFHRAGGWVNHCAGRRVDAPEPALPTAAEDWPRFAVRGGLPAGWPCRAAGC